MSVDCRGRCWQGNTESKASPRDSGEFSIACDVSVGLIAGVESNTGVGLSISSMCCKILGRGTDSFSIVSQNTNTEA
jgi:hypothetical protein